MLVDINNAIEWIVKNISEYNGDNTNIHLAGHVYYKILY